jgi:hypothetical protein
VRFVPSWAPGAGFKRLAMEVKTTLGRVDNVPFTWAKEKIVSERLRQHHKSLNELTWQKVSGGHVESFVSKHLGDNTQTEEEEDIIKWCSAALYTGGADTVRLLQTSCREFGPLMSGSIDGRCFNCFLRAHVPLSRRAEEGAARDRRNRWR